MQLITKESIESDISGSSQKVCDEHQKASVDMPDTVGGLYKERQHGDGTCGIHAINHFIGTRVCSVKRLNETKVEMLSVDSFLPKNEECNIIEKLNESLAGASDEFKNFLELPVGEYVKFMGVLPRCKIQETFRQETKEIYNKVTEFFKSKEKLKPEKYSNLEEFLRGRFDEFKGKYQLSFSQEKEEKIFGCFKSIILY